MHISEGILPLKWAVVWYGVSVPFVARGIASVKRRTRSAPEYKILMGMVAAVVFIISCLPVPVPTAGTCSHPCGTGLAAILIGPIMTVFITSIALLIQAIFLAHGGLSTLGADIFSMGVVGAFSGWFVYRGLVKVKCPVLAAAFFAGVLSDWATYATTSLQLALGLTSVGNFLPLFWSVLIAFIPTQLPLGILEGAMSAGSLRFLLRRRPDIFDKLRNYRGLASRG
ncbi:MAG: energy-coupling factor ABC transporter permease [Candidatus Omnitrophota bacterium]